MASNDQPLTDVECREQALAGVRDALAGIQSVPAAGLDGEKHETVREMVEDATALERSLANEVGQMREDGSSDE